MLGSSVLIVQSSVTLFLLFNRCLASSSFESTLPIHIRTPCDTIYLLDTEIRRFILFLLQFPLGISLYRILLLPHNTTILCTLSLSLISLTRTYCLDYYLHSSSYPHPLDLIS